MWEIKCKRENYPYVYIYIYVYYSTYIVFNSI